MSIKSEIDRIKAAIAAAYQAVGNKGGTVPAADTAANLAQAIGTIPSGITPTGTLQIVANQNGIDVARYALADVDVPPPAGWADVSGVTAAASNVLNTKYFVTSAGVLTKGTMSNRGAVTKVLTAAEPSYTITKGYHNGSGTVGIDPTNLDAANIRRNISALGLTGSFSNFTVSASTTVTMSGQKTISVSGLALDGLTPKFIAIYCTSTSYSGTSGVPVYVSGWIDLTGVAGVISRHTMMYASTSVFFNGNSSSRVTYTTTANGCSVTLNYNNCIFKSGVDYYVRLWA